MHNGDGKGSRWLGRPKKARYKVSSRLGTCTPSFRVVEGAVLASRLPETPLQPAVRCAHGECGGFVGAVSSAPTRRSKIHSGRERPGGQPQQPLLRPAPVALVSYLRRRALRGGGGLVCVFSVFLTSTQTKLSETFPCMQERTDKDYPFQKLSDVSNPAALGNFGLSPAGCCTSSTGLLPENLGLAWACRCASTV